MNKKLLLWILGICIVFLILFVNQYTGFAVINNGLHESEDSAKVSLASQIESTDLGNSIAETLSKEPILTSRTASSDNYFLGNNSYSLVSYAGDVNMMDETGAYMPFEDVVGFVADNDKMTLSWLGKSVIFNLYVKDSFDTKVILSDMNLDSKTNLSLETSIESGRGFFSFNHTLDRNNQPSKLGYDIVAKGVDCKAEEYALICGGLRISFLEAAIKQNLNVDVSAGNVEFSGADLSYIDPTVTLYQTSRTFVSKESGNYYDASTDRFVGLSSGARYHRSWIDFDSSEIPDGSTITNVNLTFKTNYAVQGGCSGSGCTANFLRFYEMTVPCGSYSECWNVVDDNTLYSTISNMDELQWDNREESIDLGSSADTDLQNRLSDNDFGVGMLGYEAGGSNEIYIRFTSDTSSISVTYSDTTAPTTTASAKKVPSGASYSFGTISGESLNITLTCSDVGSGCDYTKYCIDSSNTCTPATGTTYTAPFVHSTEGTRYLRYLSVDLSSNFETTKSSTMIIDVNAPNTTASAVYHSTPSISYTFGELASDTLNITFNCSDAIAGCASTYYCIDTSNSCTPSSLYSSSFENAIEGTSYVRFYSNDSASPANKETLKYQIMIIDSTGRTAIANGIDDSILVSPTIDTDKQLQIRYKNGTQMEGTFEKVVSYGSQRWAFNYVSADESYTHMTSIAPALYVWENSSLTSDGIEYQVEALINSTKI